MAKTDRQTAYMKTLNNMKEGGHKDSAYPSVSAVIAGWMINLN